MTEVNIKGIDKVELLKALWENSKPVVIFMLSDIDLLKFDYDKAKESVMEYIDYFMVGCIKCNLSKDEVHPNSCDKDYEEQKFQEIVNSLKK